jgi:putative hydrolase of the HAD superfamily
VIKAVFFDWFGTLAHYHPPREQLLSQALQELGLNVSPDDIKPALMVADREFYEENAAASWQDMTDEERGKMFLRQQQRMLERAGVQVSGDMPHRIFVRTRELYAGLKFALFDDVLGTMKALKERDLTLGLLTNLRRDIDSICREMGMEPYLDFTVTSAEVGAEKPHPPVFLAALEHASVTAEQALHVGDQYSVDVVGARNLGIHPILLDREDVYPEVNDCPRIRTLTQVTTFLN